MENLINTTVIATAPVLSTLLFPSPIGLAISLCSAISTNVVPNGPPGKLNDVNYLQTNSNKYLQQILGPGVLTAFYVGMIVNSLGSSPHKHHFHLYLYLYKSAKLTMVLQG